MARPTGNHDARRHDLAAAVWRVLAARGFAGLTLRAIATDLGASTGVITHYFANKRELVAFALTLLEQRRVEHAVAVTAAVGLPALRAALVGMLPIDPPSTEATRIWVSSWDAALADASFAADHANRYRAGRERLAQHVRTAQRLHQIGPGDPILIADTLHGLALGVATHALLEPGTFTPQHQIKIIDHHLGTLAPTTPPE